MAKEMDAIDVVFKIGIFATFVIFGLALWLMKKDAQKKKEDEGKEKNDDWTPA
ncbi:MAG: hypothetical protein ACYS18_04465 [Planctomycetota bacterium]|jgi:hypothetical protein